MSALEALPCPLPMWGKFTRYDRRCGMGFGPRVARDQANNAFDLRRVVTGAGFDADLAEPIEPQNSTGVHHDLNDGGISQRAGNPRPHRRTAYRVPLIPGQIGRTHV